MVASDGHSYERSAIDSVLRDGNGLSPLTRERLQPNVLIPNRNLKRRIEEHEEDRCLSRVLFEDHEEDAELGYKQRSSYETHKCLSRVL